MSSLSRATRYWTATDRNTLLPPLDTLMLQNRLIWLTIALLLLGLGYWRFRFDAAGQPLGAAKLAAAEPPQPVLVPRAPRASGPLATRSSSLQQLLGLTRFDVRFVFKTPAFFVLLAIGVLNAFGGLQQTVSVRGVDYLPVTRAVVDMLNGSFTIIAVIIAIYYAGELVWRDHDRQMHELIGATPAPDWTFVLPKILAITLVLAATYLACVLMAVVFQYAHGYSRIELGHYLLWFVLPGVVGALQLACLAVFVQVVVPHKFSGWIVMLLYIVATITLASTGFEHKLYLYGSSPDVPLSDMNGLGRFWIARAWFDAYWLAFGAILIVLAHGLWRRGAEVRFRPRLRRLARRLTGPTGLVLAVFSAAWIALGVHNFYNTNILNPYLTQIDLEREQAKYERFPAALRTPATAAHPRRKARRRALPPAGRGAYRRLIHARESRRHQRCRACTVRWDAPRLEMNALEIDGARLEKDFAPFHYRIYAFDPPMQPGERRQLRFRSTLRERGFPDARPLTRIVENGKLR